jgi:hypothetical protein
MTLGVFSKKNREFAIDFFNVILINGENSPPKKQITD